METMDDAAFAAWLAEGAIDNRHREPGRLYFAFRGADGVHWTMPAPDDAEDLHRWLADVVRAASADGPWWLRRRYGGGWWPGEGGTPESAELERAASAAGVPRGFEGALGFGADEREALLALLASYATWEWGMGEDLFLVPYDRSCAVMFCHDEEFHLHAPTRERLDAFCAAFSVR